MKKRTFLWLAVGCLLTSPLFGMKKSQSLSFVPRRMGHKEASLFNLVNYLHNKGTKHFKDRWALKHAKQPNCFVRKVIYTKKSRSNSKIWENWKKWKKFEGWKTEKLESKMDFDICSFVEQSRQKKI